MRVPQRETGMTPYEIMLSESQERMLLVAEQGPRRRSPRRLQEVGTGRGGRRDVKDDGMLRVKNHGEVVAEISNRALADEAPIYNRPYTKPLRTAPLHGAGCEERRSRGRSERCLLPATSARKRWIWQQYDFQVRTNTLAGPGAEAAIVRIKETGTSVAMSLDGNGRYCSLDPREGTKLIVAECCRNLSTVGALPIAATNNLNFGNPERPEIMAQLVESIEGMAEACRFFETPITGGNVSLYNETLGDADLSDTGDGHRRNAETALPIGIPVQNEGRAILLLAVMGCPTPRNLVPASTRK